MQLNQLSFRQFIGAFGSRYIVLHPTCPGDANHSCNGQCWDACDQERKPQVVACNTLEEVLSMCRIKHLSQDTHHLGCKGITQQMYEEDGYGYSRGTQSRRDDRYSH